MKGRNKLAKKRAHSGGIPLAKKNRRGRKELSAGREKSFKLVDIEEYRRALRDQSRAIVAASVVGEKNGTLRRRERQTPDEDQTNYL